MNGTAKLPSVPDAHLDESPNGSLKAQPNGCETVLQLTRSEPLIITIIAVSYFGSDDIAPYIVSLQTQSFRNWQIVFVDNSENEAEWEKLQLLCRGDSRVGLVKPSHNLGYLGAVDWVMSFARYRGQSWTIVSNTDLRWSSTESLAILNAIPPDSIGVIAPRITSKLSGDDQNPYQTVRPGTKKMSLMKLLFANLTTGQITVVVSTCISYLRRNGSRDASNSRSEIYAAHGSCFALSREFFDRGGSTTFPLFLFGEELFIAEQAASLGLSVVYDPQIEVEHNEHGGTGIFRSRKVIGYQRDAVRYGHKLVKSAREDAS